MEEMVTIPRSEYEMLKESVSAMASTIKLLEEEIALLKGSRNSCTSSTSPSHDLSRSNQMNQREKSIRKTGGQLPPPGSTLEMTTTPDEVIEHSSSVCSRCGQDLSTIRGTVSSCRQQVDLPVIRPHWVEHRVVCRTCPCCGVGNKGEFPSEIKAPVQYGCGVKSAVAYFSVYQYLPYQRICQLLSDLFGLRLSQGSVDNILAKMSLKSELAYREIQDRICQSDVVGADETGCRVNGSKHWFHVWQNNALTFIVSHASRGFKVIEENFAEGFPNAYFVSDCWAAQLKTPAKSHQLCLAHLLRELSNFEQNLHCQWSAQMKSVLQEAIALKKILAPEDYIQPPKSVGVIAQKVDELLMIDHQKSHQKVQAFVKRLTKNRNSILTFLTNLEVPPDNNGSYPNFMLIQTFRVTSFNSVA